ncbi:DUF6615 family protein [Faunimonas sp. B44]|uniref:DUF6615 family protein n=1 Tax=Faunimonas sp. B44 TaxID=3461493 RepID=UPI004044B924
MTFAPLFGSPCDLAQRIPSMISDFLDLENKIGRRFREDSVTDIIIASLLRIAGTNATVLVPPEAKTGGDFDILIVEPSTSEAIQYRIQAKRLSPHATNWMRGLYRELDHPHGTGKQSSTLIRSSVKEKIETIPLYAFYNPEEACKASGGIIAGIELADGRAINEVVKALLKAKKASKRPRLKQVGFLRDLFFPLSTILCPPTGGASPPAAMILPPRVSRAAVEATINERSRPEWMWREEVPQLPSLVPDRFLRPPLSGEERPRPRRPDQLAPITRPFPLLVERAIGRSDHEEPIQVARIKRPKIILVSRTIDDA